MPAQTLTNGPEKPDHIAEPFESLTSLPRNNARPFFSQSALVKLALVTSLYVALHTQNTLADPWVSAGDVRTRHHLLILIDHGAINIPVTTWPLMWNDIKVQLDTIDITGLNETEVWSYRYLKHELRKAMETVSGYASVYKSTNRSLAPASNTEIYRGERNAALNLTLERFAFRVQGQYVQSPEDDEEARMDGSYGALSLGNWVLGAGLIDRWWGPGWHSSMSLSTNARPPTGVFIQRSDSTLLPKAIPWSLTAFAAALNDEFATADSELSGLRFSTRPIPILELGYQYLDMAFDPIVIDGENLPATEMQYQGLDARLSFNLIGFQSAFNYQLIEKTDASGAKPKGEIYGFEGSFNLYNMHHRLVVEHSESDAGFSEGYRFMGRNIGYMAGEQGKAQSLLGFHYLPNGHHIEWYATKADVEVWPETLEYAQVAYHFPYGEHALISFGAMHYMEEFKLDGERIRPGNFIKFEYAF